MSAIPVERADLCVNCNTVFDRREYAQCPVCASEAVMHLQTVTEPKVEAIDRDEYLRETR